MSSESIGQERSPNSWEMPNVSGATMLKERERLNNSFLFPHLIFFSPPATPDLSTKQMICAMVMARRKTVGGEHE